MPTIARTVAALIVAVGAMLGLADSAVAATCTTQSECELQEDLRDTAARRDEYARMVSNQTEAHAAAIQTLNAAGARRAGDKEARLQAILQRRREVYARTHS